LDYLGGAVCYVCGHSSKWGCEFDFHHYKGQKDFAIGKKISNNIAFEIIKPELEKCKVLCRNCHSIISSTIWKEPDFPEDIRSKILFLTQNKQ